MLKKLSLKGVGPAPEMEVEFAERLTVITGDNGYGKTLILDAIWYCCTGVAFNSELFPNKKGLENGETYLKALFSKTKDKSIKIKYKFSRKKQKWRKKEEKNIEDELKTVDVPLIYFGDNSKIGVYEPRHSFAERSNFSIFSEEELWNGSQKSGQIPSVGIVNNISRWLNNNSDDDQILITSFQKCLEIFSDYPEKHPLKLKKSERMSLDDPRDIPILETPTGERPITGVSSATRRVLGIIYAIIWLWNEHVQASKIIESEISNGMVILIDEIETHMHPKRQHKILNAILEAVKIITNSTDINITILVTTHSPIVLTGIEPHFNPATDKLLDLQLTPGAPDEQGTVELREVDWYKRGTVGNWLTSDMFNVSERSPEAQKAMDEAAALIELPEPDKEKVWEVDEKLRNLLPDTDRFLVRWDYICEQRNLLPSPEY